MYWCDPKWHNNQKIPAEYFLLAPPHERGPHMEPSAFACCEPHLVDATKVMLDKHSSVTVRRVNAPSQQKGNTV
jgi:hypothetical protein